jgi:hypothetical protein
MPSWVAMSALAWAPYAALGQRAHATLASLVVSLGLDVPALLSRTWDEKSVGVDGASLIVDVIVVDLCQLVLARNVLGVESDRRHQPHSASCTATMA